MTNIILATDSYKLGHWQQYPPDTEVVYSYLEARAGAQHPYTVFFGLQYILKRYLEGRRVAHEDVSYAASLAATHFGNPALFNRGGWEHIVDEHRGILPLRIKAVPEGTVVPIGNVLMTVENTCPQCYWLTNAVESLLTHVWYPTTVATLSRDTLALIGTWLDVTAESREGLPFMLHDFGYRGASSHESAAIGGAAHLVNGLGTDTLPGMTLAIHYYDADPGSLAFSVPATEHSVMTAQGAEGEAEVVARVLDAYPTGIVSVVADSYNIYDFVTVLGTSFKDRILARDGVFVVRPDSVTGTHITPASLVLALLESLWRAFAGTKNSKGYKVLDPHVRMLWGDGIDPAGIDAILDLITRGGFSAENLVFGMGGGLLQKVNRDTERFAFKASAMRDANGWRPVSKDPLDSTKASKRGRLKLTEQNGIFTTCALGDDGDDVLRTVFEDGDVTVVDSFEKIRARAAKMPALTS